MFEAMQFSWVWKLIQSTEATLEELQMSYRTFHLDQSCVFTLVKMWLHSRVYCCTFSQSPVIKSTEVPTTDDWIKAV